LSFGGSLQHWLIAERLTPYLAAASRSVSNTSPVVMHLTFPSGFVVAASP